jgi:molybdopterin-guanine dinucleotide biosynthesis protein A
LSGVSGAILAGGQSRRFGSDKSIAEVAGERLIDRVLAAMRPVVDEVLVVGGARLALGADVCKVDDAFPGAGPLGGLATALAAARKERVLLLGCDLPLVTEKLLRALLDRAGEVDAVVPQGPRGLEPLCAVYEKTCLGPVRDALARGERKMDVFHGKVRVLFVPTSDLPDAFGLANVNTPEELRRVEETLRSSPRE